MNSNILVKYLLKISLNHLMTLVYLLIYFLTFLVTFCFQFEECIIYCFHAEFVFDFALNVLIAVYRPEVKRLTLLFLN